jgi:hypothetical protein
MTSCCNLCVNSFACSMASTAGLVGRPALYHTTHNGDQVLSATLLSPAVQRVLSVAGVSACEDIGRDCYGSCF